MIKKIFTFKGCAKRLEFWVINILVACIVLIPAYTFFANNEVVAEKYVAISSLATLWPFLAVQARRWHDRNKSALWILINFVPVIGFFWVIIENGFLGSVEKDNRYRMVDT